MTGLVVDREIGSREHARDHPAHDLAVGAATRSRRKPAHHLAEVAGVGRAGRGDGLVDERVDLRVSTGPAGRYSVRMSISACSLAARSARPPFVYASTDSRRVLTSRVRTARYSSSVRGALVALLDVVGGVRGHPQDVAAQRITAAHRGGDVGLDAISKGHRSWLPRAVVADARGAAGRRWRVDPAQPACVRAFFLRLASLRLRFTDGFS